MRHDQQNNHAEKKVTDFHGNYKKLHGNCKRKTQTMLLIAVIFSFGAFSFAEEFSYSPISESAIITIPKGDEIGSFSEKIDVGGRRALRIDFNCAEAKYTQFSFMGKDRLILQNPSAKLVVTTDIYVPEENKISFVNLRVTDRNGEYFQYRYVIPVGVKGWTTAKYEINTTAIQHSSWGSTVDKKLDWPLSINGFAVEFNTSVGIGYFGFGEIKVVSGE